MFCTKCGAQFADGSAFCPTCGAPSNAAPQQPVYQQPVQPQQPVYQQPAQPQYQQPVYQQPVQPQYQQPYQPAPAGDLGATLKKNLALILVVIACFGALMFILNTFQILELPVTVKMGSFKMLDGESRSVSDIADTFDAADKSFALGYIANILCGVANLAVAAIGILYFLKEKNNMPYYDQFVGKFLKGMTPGFAMGVIGAAGAVLQFILMLLTGFTKDGASMSVSVHWLTWVTLVIYAALAAVDFLVINKKK